MSIEPQLLDLRAFTDNRGVFVKTFNQSHFNNLGLDFQLRESYYSVSAKDVIRGMHFQVPPYDHSKIVFCPWGSILDVLVDIRERSPNFGKCYAHILSAENHKAFYVPSGFAHGFKSMVDGAITYYLVSSEHHPSSDMGIAYDSIDFDWQCDSPIMSDRDKNFVDLKAFKSPFR